MIDNPPFLRLCSWVYLVLIAFTLTTFAVGVLGLSGLSFSLLVLGIALVKGQLVADFFMGLGGLRGPWRWVILIWLTLIGVIITLAFTLSS